MVLVLVGLTEGTHDMERCRDEIRTFKATSHLYPLLNGGNNEQGVSDDESFVGTNGDTGVALPSDLGWLAELAKPGREIRQSVETPLLRRPQVFEYGGLRLVERAAPRCR